MTEVVRKKFPNGAILEHQAERYAAARRTIAEERIAIMHIRPVAESAVGVIGSHNGGLTVAYRQAEGDSFVEIATSLCRMKDIYNRKAGTVLSVEQFSNMRRIRVPTFGLAPSDVVRSLFQPHFTFEA